MKTAGETANSLEHSPISPSLIGYLLGLFAAAGGAISWASSALVFPKAYLSIEVWPLCLPLILVGVAALLTFGRHIFLRTKAGFLLLNLSLFVSVAFVLFSFELWGRFQRPSWPARALHGVSTEMSDRYWNPLRSFSNEVIRANSWGQRDRERRITRNPETRRVIFVGDSFLESSSVSPVNILVEQRLEGDVEVVNLGVAATSPEDYYWRIKNLALRLSPSDIFLFFYVGNDFIPHPKYFKVKDTSTALYDGFTSPEPKESLLFSVLPGANYLLSLRKSVSYRVMFQDDLLGAEHQRYQRLLEAGPARLPDELIKYYGGRRHLAVLEELRRRDLSVFYQQLQQADLGLFRSYSISPLLQAIAGEQRFTPRDTKTLLVKSSAQWLSEIRAVVEESGVRFKIVIVPQAFDVDGRFYETWLPLGDLRQTARVDQSMVKELLELLAEFDCVDLHSALQAERGTYLNFDGHWSTKGNEIAARRLAEEIRQ